MKGRDGLIRQLRLYLNQAQLLARLGWLQLRFQQVARTKAVSPAL